ncbi:3-dehydroquinate synthase [Cerasicoccus arenae]|uniref:3-dehydroquinate synthase n=1 Tax=Cerasicoccus arenae TaxID=424488 RepID=A0A8J3DCZ6_9BACT|nr:3-dehydroquinate synthase [Cerasicoccus arenae]MBK1857834.1 3-dehydroquinate synthase [Cerasicoccus arenae]GHC11595.1 3-dehydroquinate synthase [Cerasicoccus arenae]
MPSATHQFHVTPQFAHRILFTENALQLGNPTLEEALRGDAVEAGESLRVFACIDDGLRASFPNLANELTGALESMQDGATPVELVAPPMMIPGGEACKNDWSIVEQLWKNFYAHPLSRHSCVLVIGGGAVLDVVGFAAATAHRGLRLLRMPTTTLSQGDSGVGVKCGVNRFGQKNWLGAFAVPWAVVNDLAFLRSQPERDRRAGLAEALKVALVRDAKFFDYLEQHAEALQRLDEEPVQYAVAEGARIHAEHIATGGDPFEMGSGRPLDFGHWSAHKLEQLTDFQLPHGEAVAVGMMVDLHYAEQVGLLAMEDLDRIQRVARRMGLLAPLARPEVVHALEAAVDNPAAPLLRGLEEFRLHLGGELCLCMVTVPGVSCDIHTVDSAALRGALRATLVLLEDVRS